MNGLERNNRTGFRIFGFFSIFCFSLIVPFFLVFPVKENLEKPGEDRGMPGRPGEWPGALGRALESSGEL